MVAHVNRRLSRQGLERRSIRGAEWRNTRVTSRRGVTVKARAEDKAEVSDSCRSITMLRGTLRKRCLSDLFSASSLAMCWLCAVLSFRSAITSVRTCGCSGFGRSPPALVVTGGRRADFDVRGLSGMTAGMTCSSDAIRYARPRGPGDQRDRPLYSRFCKFNSVFLGNPFFDEDVELGSW